MASIIPQECINGYVLNKQNIWTCTPIDFEQYNQYNQIKYFKKEQKEREILEKEKLNMGYNYYNTNPIPNPNPNHNTVQFSTHAPVQEQPYFNGTDIYGFNHYSSINSSGILVYYYIDKSGLYHYYN